MQPLFPTPQKCNLFFPRKMQPINTSIKKAPRTTCLHFLRRAEHAKHNVLCFRPTVLGHNCNFATFPENPEIRGKSVQNWPLSFIRIFIGFYARNRGQKRPFFPINPIKYEISDRKTQFLQPATEKMGFSGTLIVALYVYNVISYVITCITYVITML